MDTAPVFENETKSVWDINKTESPKPKPEIPVPEVTPSPATATKRNLNYTPPKVATSKIVHEDKPIAAPKRPNNNILSNRQTSTTNFTKPKTNVSSMYYNISFFVLNFL